MHIASAVPMAASFVALPSRSGALLAGIDTAPRTAHEALPALVEVSARLRARRDPRAAFPDVYAIITRNVITAIRRGVGAPFLEPEWISRLAGRFCTRYFDALRPAIDGSPVASGAWSIGFAAVQRGGMAPVHDALFGINAHINFDLAQGLRDNIRASGAGRDARMLRRYRHDHDAVNEILRASMDEILACLIERHGCEVTRRAAASRWRRAALARATMAVLRPWRSRVWAETLALLAAPTRLDEQRLIRTYDRHSAAIAHVIAAIGSARAFTR